MCFPLSLVEVEVDLHHIEGTMILRTDTGKTGRKKERERERERERDSKIQKGREFHCIQKKWDFLVSFPSNTQRSHSDRFSIKVKNVSLIPQEYMTLSIKT